VVRYLDLRGRLSRAVAVELLSHLTLWKSSDEVEPQQESEGERSSQGEATDELK